MGCAFEISYINCKWHKHPLLHLRCFIGVARNICVYTQLFMMAVRFLCCLWILLWTCLTSCRSQADVKNSSLNIMIMISTSERFNSSNAVGAVNLAMKHIDADESLLEGLKLLAANVTDSKVIIHLVYTCIYLLTDVIV